VKAIISNMVALYGILPGDWTGNPAALQISSAPAPTAATPVAQFVSTAARNRAEQHKALPARSGGQSGSSAGGQAVVAAPGVRRVAVE
jgi:hypothetical protein